jgi:hypothetical protein
MAARFRRFARVLKQTEYRHTGRWIGFRELEYSF